MVRFDAPYPQGSTGPISSAQIEFVGASDVSDGGQVVAGRRDGCDADQDASSPQKVAKSRDP